MRERIWVSVIIIVGSFLWASKGFADNCPSYWTEAYKRQNCSGYGGGGGYARPTYAPPAVHQPSPTELKERQSAALSNQADAQLNRGNFVEAFRLYELSFNLATTKNTASYALTQMGVAQHKLRNFEEAIKLGERALAMGGLDEKNARVTRQNIANAYAWYAKAAEDSGDNEKAYRQLELALRYAPKDNKLWSWAASLRQKIDDNLKSAQQEQQDMDNQKKQQEASTKIQAALGQLTQTLNADASAAKTVPGLNFIDSRASNTTAALTPVNPPTVDARNVPSGLPKSVEDAIPHTTAGDRVRKGFEAIHDHDWTVARAWFQDALNKDPKNPGLQRLVELAQYMERGQIPADKKIPISQQVGDFKKKVDAEFEQNTADIVKAFIVPPSPDLFSKSLDEQAKALIRPDSSKFESGLGVPVTQDRARQLAHETRVQALRFEALANQRLLAQVNSPSKEIDWVAVNQANTSRHLMSYAAEVERCNCAPAVANRDDSDILFLFPNQ